MNRKLRAFALPLVLWSVAFLTVISLTTVGMVDRWIDSEILAERRLAARAQALSGLAVGCSAEVERGDPLLITGNAEKDGYEVHISSESGRINPNYWLAQENREIFETLFLNWKVENQQRDIAIDSMLDWVDKDDFAERNGAERGDYAARGKEGFPPNRPFVSLRELRAVRGLGDILDKHESSGEAFTLWHKGKLSVLYATPEMLEALAGFSETQAASFVALRKGEDGIDGTKDDKKFSGMEEVAALAGANAGQQVKLEAYFDLGEGARRLDCTGWAAGASYRISAVVTEGGQFLHWEEQ
jgi:hypothetical protein